MDIDFSAEDVAFRDEVRAFLAQAYTDELEELLAKPDTFKASRVQWQKRLYERGWVAPNWPVEYGGAGWSITQTFIYQSECSAIGAPDVIPFGLKMVGPVIYTYGNEEQKQRFLPPILSSDVWWCQGYSEPGAGSDLASLKTKAELVGDEYIVSGAKIWTTYAQFADWIFCLVRTGTEGRPQEGISFLLIDMTSPGITVNRIDTIDSQHTLNEVVFDNVRVPVTNRIGEENHGWTYAKSLLAHERSGIAEVASSNRLLSEIRQRAKQELNGGKRLIDDPLFQHRLANVEIELMALEYTELRTLATTSKGKGPGVESSLLKIKGTEIQQALQELMLQLAGYYGGVERGDLSLEVIGHDFGDRARKAYMYGRAATIYGGSNEIQKNITAKHVLGL